MSKWPPALETLVERFRDAGLAVRDASFFATTGIGVSSPAGDDIAEAIVFIYPSDSGWEMRITLHGGPHWTRKVTSLEDVERLTRSHLSNAVPPPGPGWEKTQ